MPVQGYPAKCTEVIANLIYTAIAAVLGWVGESELSSNGRSMSAFHPLRLSKSSARPPHPPYSQSGAAKQGWSKPRRLGPRPFSSRCIVLPDELVRALGKELRMASRAALASVIRRAESRN